jgi:hypothetical protein
MEKCVRCGSELEGGEEVKTCIKCGTCYTKDEQGTWIHSDENPDECKYK